MGLEYYAFALFVAGLICAIAIICKVLFANVKRQKKLLDERETQILQLYNSVETLMEEFNDQLKITTAELKEQEYRATSQIPAFDLPPALEKKEQALEKLPRTLPLDANRIRVAGEVLERAERIVKSDKIIPPFNPPPEKEENGAVFQKFFDETAESTPMPPPTAAEKKATVKTKTAMILALSAEGKTDIEIASELGITRNEVLLVVGLKK
ncbi:MAG: hypothetical protein FWD38_06800 [Oscillospiraceae bacterium]|nr:hypothetical protein [Oscillospiraceae bacterium]